MADTKDASASASSPKGKRKMDSPEAGSASKVARPEMEKFSETLLQLYYAHLFPYEFMERWLSYGTVQFGATPENVLRHREFSFTLKDDIYIRYQSFDSMEDRREGDKKIRGFRRTLQDRNAYKIDIGAIYSFPPRDHNMIKATEFVPKQKEVVFDIDMTDYDDVRTCCSGADICHRCWPLMTVAMEVIDAALRQDFGFEHILWVYSGRRGIHCWVCDTAARALSNEGRSAVANNLAVYVSSSDANRRPIELSTPLYPSLRRAYESSLLPAWENTILHEQRWLLDEDKWTRFLANVPDTAAAERLAAKWRGEGGAAADDEHALSMRRWREVQVEMRAFKLSKFNSSEQALQELVFLYTYPRLDIHVSKQLNHLLKSPFCAHPKTGRVCVPIPSPQTGRHGDFDYAKVPTLGQVVQEYNATTNADPNKPAWLNTTLRNYFGPFEKEFLLPLERSIRQEAAHTSKSMDW